MRRPSVGELAGKTLGCWCAPHACHGDVLARLDDQATREEVDPLCACGHRASGHASPDTGDTRCLAIEHPADLAYVLDDGREHNELAYCACPRFTADNPPGSVRS